MKRLLLAAAALGPFATTPALAAPETMPLTPGNMLAQTHSRAMLFDISGTYRQLHGRLDFDPATRACSIDVTFVIRSLTAPNALVRAQVMSRGFLDPARYPTARFQGRCSKGGTEIAGMLTLHGQTHPFTMTMTDVTRGGALIGFDTRGVLDRYEWGLNGLRMMVGRTITVTNAVSLDGKPPSPAS
ncbi:MAG TPA: YceI family protein [Acetobacteraceae bacterium]|nr:YceI family protein [Acetobacteraceae bacterium]